MAQIINTNVMSINSQRNLNRSLSSMQTSLERLSSGLRINRAKDDAAGLAISERFTEQIRGLEQANRNANDGISMVQTAEGFMEEIHNMMQRMRELSIQARNGTVSSADKASLDDEYQQLAEEIIRVKNVAEFNNTVLLAADQSLDIQVGWKETSDNRIMLHTYDIMALSGITSAVSTATITSAAGASVAMAALEVSIDSISEIRSDWGAKQNRMEATVRNNENVVENQSAARSRIKDADFARETANLTRTQILQQAGVAMLAQANQLPQNVLQLLG